MGLDYAYEMWVPQKRLYEFLEVVNKYSDKWGRTLFHWPDGRKLEFYGSGNNYRGQHPQEVAFDCSMDEYFHVSLICGPDEELRNSSYHYSIEENGNYRICCIDVKIDMSPDYTRWLDEEGDYAYVSFTTFISAISRDFQNSPSIRRVFLDIAREGGAVSCVLDTEGSNDRTFFLDGEELNEKGFAYAHFRDLRGLLNPNAKISDAEQHLLICQHRGEPSQHELLALIEWAQHDKDAGVRAADCKALAKVKSGEVEKVLCEIARQDNNWRVRYVANCCLKERESKLSEETLFDALYDENYQVRIAAIKTLLERENGERNLADELADLIAKLPVRGESMGAFYAALKALNSSKLKVESRHVQIIRRRMSEPDFPFEAEATQTIKRLKI